MAEMERPPQALIMKFRHLRNATALLTLGAHRLLIDPMLAKKGELMAFRPFGGQRNPIVDLPREAEAALEEATGAIITHAHPDHLDRAGVELLRSKRLPVWCAAEDVASLHGKGLDARPLVNGALGCEVEAIATKHGRGLLGLLMGKVRGFYLAHPNEPSLYLIGDSILTPAVREAVTRLQPDVIVAPAGAANLGFGSDLLFSVAELRELASLAKGQLVLNHLEALDHCPTKRADLDFGLVPADGEELAFA
jgi:L-ascorbate metabolism protein UlaG (beta-lactamase superfamily)